MKIPRAVSLILLCFSVVAAAPPSGKKKAKPADEPASAATAEAEKGPGSDGRKRIENYLAERTKKFQLAHASRMDFSGHETLMWEEYWGKVREARKTFELRTARQTVDLFSTLETLEPKDHASTIADYEKLRATMVKSFETQEKQKMQEFFAAREARWKQFAEAQERDRAAFAAEAESAWQDDKNFLTSLYSPPATAKAGP